MVDRLITTISVFAIELRREQINYSYCDKLRNKIDELAEMYRQDIKDDRLYRKIKDIGFQYHNTNIENVQQRYNLVGMCYYCTDRLDRLHYKSLLLK